MFRFPFPFGANASQADAAEFELFAQAMQDGGLLVEGFFLEGAGDEVGAFSFLAVVDQGVAGSGALQMGEGFGEDAGPEESEIADVAEDFTTGFGFPFLGFDEHLGHFAERAAAGVSQAIDGFHAGEPHEQIREIIDERRIDDSQVHLERLFRQSAEEIAQGVFSLNQGDHVLPPLFPGKEDFP